MSIDYGKEYACKGCPCVNVDATFAMTHGMGRPHEKCNLGKWNSADESTELPEVGQCDAAPLLKALPDANIHHKKVQDTSAKWHDVWTVTVQRDKEA